jgi:hypothetical protein
MNGIESHDSLVPLMLVVEERISRGRLDQDLFSCLVFVLWACGLCHCGDATSAMNG